jgi:preprotein translocase SecE subunit
MSPMATTNQPTKESAKGDKPAKKPEPSTPLSESIPAYFKGVKAEWGKISWPTWPQIWGQTIVVLVMVSVMTLGLFLMDNLFHTVVTLITPHSS